MANWNPVMPIRQNFQININKFIDFLNTVG